MAERVHGSIKITDVIRLLPVIIAVSVVFLLVRACAYSMPVSQYSYMSITSDSMMYDIFTYIKSAATISAAAMALVFFVFLLITGKRKIRKTNIYIPMAIYAFFILLSYFCSKYKYFALYGSPDRLEGTIVHVSYLVILFYAINCIDGEREVRFIIDTLFVAVFIACLIGLSQLLNHDFFRTGLGTALMMGGLDAEPFYGYIKLVYQTVYNENYVAFYLCMLVPLVIDRILDVIRLTRTEEVVSRPRKIYLGWLALLLILIVVNIAGADSIGSVPGLIFGIAAVIIERFVIYRKKMVQTVFVVLMLAGAVLVSVGAFGAKYSPFKADSCDRPDIEYFKTYGSTVEIKINDNILAATYDASVGEFYIKDDEGMDLDVFMLPENQRKFWFDDDRFNEVISFTPLAYDGAVFGIFETEDAVWRFKFTDAGVRYVNEIGRDEQLDVTRHANVFKNYSFGSGRGYLWDTTLPLIMDHVLVGAGADTFMFVFPQTDYAARYSHGLEVNCIYDKPHNLYLQLALSFGVTGLIAFLAMIVMIIKNNHSATTGIMTKDVSTLENKYLALSLCAGLISFLIAALVNDSSVSVTPMFYGLLGCLASLDLK